MDNARSSNTFPREWLKLWTVTAGSACLYIFSEWLFFATKPSFLNALSLWKQVEILIFTACAASMLALLPVLALYLLSRVHPLKRIEKILVQAGMAVPALVLSVLILLLVDNFTYTLFKTGIVHSEGFVRAGTGLAFLLVFVVVLLNIRRKTLVGQPVLTMRKTPPAIIYLGALALLTAGAALPVLFGRTQSLAAPSVASTGDLPNVLLITSDGLNATHMSAYGYERETTPNISKLAESSLFAENAFSNAGKTSGSIISILTGKYPANVRLLFIPDILRGSDSYQHLPGILRSLGYYSAQFSDATYVDAYTLNLLSGFDQANGRIQSSNHLLRLGKVLPNDLAYMVYEVGNRAIDRLLHIFFIRKMIDPFKEVMTEPDKKMELRKLDDLLELIRSTDQPLFIHYHNMGTHGFRFYPRIQVFSTGKEMEDYNPDFYDDVILQFDRDVGKILQALKDEGTYDESIIVIASDHGQKYDPRIRLPLIIHFPEGQLAVRLQENVENIDIAPTILDYLGLPTPTWMEGQSLLKGELPPHPIPSFFGPVESITSAKPPYYQFEEMTIVYCDRWYYGNLRLKQMSDGLVDGSTGACPEAVLPSYDQVFSWMSDHLETYGFDVSSLK